jgi:two-component system, NtrC family, response regulator AtoC
MLAPQNGCTVLVGDIEMEVRGYLEIALKCLGYTVVLAQDGPEVLTCLQTLRTEITAVLLDIAMANCSVDMLTEIRHLADVPVIIISGKASMPDVVTAMKNGAADFLSKPVNLDDLRRAMTRALEPKTGDGPAIRRKELMAGSFVGKSLRMREIYASLAQIGWSEAPVLIQGETGSGKEVLARELHAQSPRGGKPLVKLNCAALPSELVESELFGYERGAFTGAFQKKAGMFEIADGGTILLDEIGDMDVRLQAKLLQVLQDQEFHRIGGKTAIKVDVRVLAATHCDLEKAIADHNFREDLYYRLNVINVHVPALRDRPEDIIPLAEFFLEKHAQSKHPIPISGKLQEAMSFYHWPGNVRELENVTRRLLVLRNADMVAHQLLAKANRGVAPVAPRAEVHSVPKIPATSASVLDQVTKAKNKAETEAILSALQATRWNRKQAAMLLQIDYKALLYKMKKLGVEEQSDHFAEAANSAETEAILSALQAARWNRKQAAMLLQIDYKALLYKMKKFGVEEQSDHFAEAANSDSRVVAAASGGT